MYYNVTRFYNPQWGRFLNADDVSYLDPESINGLNLYAYCNNNPVMYSDPDRCSPKWWQLLISAAFIIAGIAMIATGVGEDAGWIGGGVSRFICGLTAESGAGISKSVFESGIAVAYKAFVIHISLLNESIVDLASYRT